MLEDLGDNLGRVPCHHLVFWCHMCSATPQNPSSPQLIKRGSPELMNGLAGHLGAVRKKRLGPSCCGHGFQGKGTIRSRKENHTEW